MRSVVPELALWLKHGMYIHSPSLIMVIEKISTPLLEKPVVAKMSTLAIGKLSDIGKGLREINPLFPSNPHSHATTGYIRAQSFLFGSSVTSLKGLDREPKNRYKP